MAITLPSFNYGNRGGGGIIGGAIGAALSQQAQSRQINASMQRMYQEQSWAKRMQAERIAASNLASEKDYERAIYQDFLTGRLGLTPEEVQEDPWLAQNMDKLGTRDVTFSALGLPSQTVISQAEVDAIRARRPIGSEIVGQNVEDLNATQMSFVTANPGLQATLSIEDPEAAISEVRSYSPEAAEGLQQAYAADGYISYGDYDAALGVAKAHGYARDEARADRELDQKSYDLSLRARADQEGRQSRFAHGYDASTGAYLGPRSSNEMRILDELDTWAQRTTSERTEEQLLSQLESMGVPSDPIGADGEPVRGTREWYTTQYRDVFNTNTPPQEKTGTAGDPFAGRTMYYEQYTKNMRGEESGQFATNAGIAVISRIRQAQSTLGDDIAGEYDAALGALIPEMESRYGTRIQFGNDPSNIDANAITQLGAGNEAWGHALNMFNERYDSPARVEQLLRDYALSGYDSNALPTPSGVDAYVELLTLTGDMFNPETFGASGGRGRSTLDLLKLAAQHAQSGGPLPPNLQAYYGMDEAGRQVARESRDGFNVDSDQRVIRTLPTPVQERIMQGTGFQALGGQVYSSSDKPDEIGMSESIAGEIATLERNNNWGEDEVFGWASEQSASTLATVGSINRAQQGLIDPEDVFTRTMRELGDTLSQYSAAGAGDSLNARTIRTLISQASAEDVPLPQKLRLLQEYFIQRQRYYDRMHNFLEARSLGSSNWDVSKSEEALEEARDREEARRRLGQMRPGYGGLSGVSVRQ